MTSPSSTIPLESVQRRISLEIQDKTQWTVPLGKTISLLPSQTLDTSTGSCFLPQTSSASVFLGFHDKTIVFHPAQDSRASLDSVWTSSSVGSVIPTSLAWIALDTVFAVTLGYGGKEVGKSLELMSESDVVTIHFFLIHLLNGKKRDEVKPRYSCQSLKCGSVEEARELRGKLAAQLYKSKHYQKAVESGGTPRMLALINPFGGTGKAVQLFNTQVLPLLKLAGFNCIVQETRYPLHATEILKNLPGNLVEEYHVIFTISGDGLFHEMINGILTRQDWEVSRKVPIGMIGAGSANALCKNIDAIHTESQVLTILRGNTLDLDVLALTQHPPHMNRPILKYAHLELLWGLIADADIESEKHRWAGMQRVTVAVIVRMFRLRKYAGRLWWLEKDYDPREIEGEINSGMEDFIDRQHLIFDPSDEVLKSLTYHAPRSSKEMSKPGTNLARIGTLSTTGSLPEYGGGSVGGNVGGVGGEASGLKGVIMGPKPKYSHLPPSHLSHPKSPWKSFASDKFTMLSAMNMPWAAQDALFAPKAKMNDGLVDISFTDETDRSNLIGGITEAQSGKLAEKNWIKNIQARAFCLWPEGSGEGMSSSLPNAFEAERGIATENSTRHVKRVDKRGQLRVGILDLDGEAIPGLPVWVEVLPRMLKLSIPGWYEDGVWGGLRCSE